MCECGCVMNWERYKFPANGDAFYLLTLKNHCVDCDGKTGVMIELIEPGTFEFKFYSDVHNIDGDLQFEQWRDGKGVAIACGLFKHEFVKKLSPHLVGIDSNEMGESGLIDECSAEVILEEMYDDAQLQPAIVKLIPQTELK